MSVNVKYVKFNSARRFGVELEMNQVVPAKDLVKIIAASDKNHHVGYSSNYEQDYQNNYWHVKFDRSCGDVKNIGGWEVASYISKGYKDVENIGKVTEALNKGGVKVNNNCGLHIHGEIADFNNLQVATLVANWVKIEPILSEMVPKHRFSNKYCKLLTKKHKFDYYKTYKPEEFWNLVRPANSTNLYRRTSLNMCNYLFSGGDRRTAELRLPECVLSGREVKNWIRFFLTFIENCKNKSFPGTVYPAGLHDMVSLCGFHNEDPFYLLSRAMLDTKIWIMERILRHSTKKKLRTLAQNFINKIIL